MPNCIMQNIGINHVALVTASDNANFFFLCKAFFIFRSMVQLYHNIFTPSLLKAKLCRDLYVISKKIK